MTVSLDKKYKTREGRAVRLLTLDVSSPFPVIGLVSTGKREYPVSWRSDGRITDYSDTQMDLVECHPLEDLPIDTPIWVRYSEKSLWHPQHFAGVSPNGVFCWENGKTSHTQNKNTNASYWQFYSLTEPYV